MLFGYMMNVVQNSYLFIYSLLIMMHEDKIKEKTAKIEHAE